MRWLTLLGGLLLVPSVWADRACFEKATGKWLGEACSTCAPGICQQNWVTDNPQLGFTVDQIEERVVTPKDVRDLVNQANKSLKDAQDANRKNAGDKVKAKLGLSSQDFQDLKDALQ